MTSVIVLAKAAEVKWATGHTMQSKCERALLH